MKSLGYLIKRNVKLFFHDKGMFFTALITPVILLVLYATFLGNVYRDAFLQSIPAELILDESILNGCVGGQLISSILAVSCVTVAFCSNMLMVQDKVSGAAMDLSVSPVKAHTLSLGYYIATLVSTLIVCYAAMGLCLGYVATVGWYLSVSDVLFLALDVLLLVLFGTALSSVIHFFLSTQGQISAVGSIVSSCYGFVCGAYMPIGAKERLLTLKNNTDGFKIAERDLQMRGSGDFFGTRQSGKMLTDIKNLRYSTQVIFLAKRLTDEAFEGRFDIDELRVAAVRKYDALKDVVLN